MSSKSMSLVPGGVMSEKLTDVQRQKLRVRRVTITEDCEDWSLISNDDDDGTHALITWTEHRAMVRVCEAADEDEGRPTHATHEELGEALDALDALREWCGRRSDE